ncbi:MCE family protein [Rhodococcus spelaei]|uniref:MCE family protein n=1 Tax=Rhodococcus spelaei TaxID=2546320 RepID=A0A541B914_9NOCA|nr:MCE family protein [Rhodococcus spelaei]TQF68811.1 MCE family protein [Rhodococcus spelaei]
MDQFTGRSRVGLAIRGALAVLVGVVVAVVMVLRGSGNLHRDPEVVVAIPASAGLIAGEAPVRYSGVNIGRIAGIDSGAQSSVVRLQIDSGSIGQVPSAVLARVVPRTFFGDIYIQLVDAPNAGSSAPLADGDTIGVDTGPDAVALYGVYKKMVDVLDRMQPQKMQTALTALGKALDGRGETIGRIVDRLGSASATLTPSAQRFLDTAPEFRSVMTALDAATPDVLATLTAATSVSRSIVEHGDQMAAMFGAAASFASVAASFVGEQRGRITTVMDSTGKILATTAANTSGLVDTLSGAESFGAAGARVFATGKFNITAVPSFAGPLPYTGADCPHYGSAYGATCGGGQSASVQQAVPPQQAVSPQPAVAAAPASFGRSDVVDGDREAPVLKKLEDTLGGNLAASAPNPATVVMLGPMVRGNEVSVR